MELEALGKIVREINQLGGTLVAISPTFDKYNRAMQEEKKLTDERDSE